MRKQIQLEDPDGNPIELFKPAHWLGLERELTNKFAQRSDPGKARL